MTQTLDRYEDAPPTLAEVLELEDSVVNRVAELKAAGVDPVERAGLTEFDRKQAAIARSVYFASITQGRGKPSRFGTGKKEQKK